jgi:hypothetical protein
VPRTRRFGLGTFKGLEFAIDRHPGGATDVVLKGATERHWQLAKESQGPRAVMNALQRLVQSYSERVEHVQSDITIGQNQLRDFEARVAVPFTHTARLETLSTLRDQLQRSLSAPNGTPQANEANAMTMAAVSAQLRELLSAKSHPDASSPNRHWVGRTETHDAVRARVGR